jgi:2-polyprenyl-6-methoxyphenol hydroxylase-like FAD-dependent oxidoreductase
MRPAGYHIGGSMILTPNALRVLDHLGVYEEIRVKGFEHEGATFYNPNYPKGGVFGTLILGSQEHYGHPALRLYRDTLRQALLDEAHRRGIEFHWNMRYTCVEQETSEFVTVAFENGEKVMADFVIGVDGINSRVRQYIAPDTPPQFTGQLCIVSFAKREKLKNQGGLKTPQIYLGKAGAFGVMPTTAALEDILFFATIQAQDRTKEEWQALDTDKEGLKTMLQKMFSGDEWPPIVHELVTNAPNDKYFAWP